jgi:hypothetical protein
MALYRRNNPLLDNGSLKNVSVTTNRRTVRNGGLYLVCLEVTKGQLSPVKADCRVEAGSNTSTVDLRVVGGDKKGSLESETVKYGGESHGTGTRE